MNQFIKQISKLWTQLALTLFLSWTSTNLKWLRNTSLSGLRTSNSLSWVQVLWCMRKEKQNLYLFKFTIKFKNYHKLSLVVTRKWLFIMFLMMDIMKVKLFKMKIMILFIVFIKSMLLGVSLTVAMPKYTRNLLKMVQVDQGHYLFNKKREEV
jgi:hypothetical protein